MAGQYGTKAWAKWANQNLDFALMLLKEPDKECVGTTYPTYLEASIKVLNIIKTALEEVG